MADVDTSQVAAATIRDGSPLDWEVGSLGRASLVESVSAKNPEHGWAQRRADELLGQRRGLPRTLELDCVPLPWLDPGDVIDVTVGGRSERVRVGSWSLSVTGAGGVAFRLTAEPWSSTSPIAGLSVAADDAMAIEGSDFDRGVWL